MISTPAMRLGVDHAIVSAVRLSIAAAMVIAESVLLKLFWNFRLPATFAGKCQQKVIQCGRDGRMWGWGGGIGDRVPKAGLDGARLFQRLFPAENARGWRRRRHPAVRARASARLGAVPAAPATRDHAAFPRFHDPRPEALEV